MYQPRCAICEGQVNRAGRAGWAYLCKKCQAEWGYTRDGEKWVAFIERMRGEGKAWLVDLILEEKRKRDRDASRQEDSTDPFVMDSVLLPTPDSPPSYFPHAGGGVKALLFDDPWTKKTSGPLAETLKALPRSSRDLLRLLAEGLSQADIARRLKISESAVSQRKATLERRLSQLAEAKKKP